MTLREAAVVARNVLAENVSGSYCEWCNEQAPTREDGLILADIPHRDDCPFGVLDRALEDEEVARVRCAR